MKTCSHSDSSGKPLADANVKNSQMKKIITATNKTVKVPICLRDQFGDKDYINYD